jgi:hypothetical protein
MLRLTPGLYCLLYYLGGLNSILELTVKREKTVSEINIFISFI